MRQYPSVWVLIAIGLWSLFVGLLVEPAMPSIAADALEQVLRRRSDVRSDALYETINAEMAWSSHLRSFERIGAGAIIVICAILIRIKCSQEEQGEKPPLEDAGPGDRK
jgi:hypothetical protein